MKKKFIENKKFRLIAVMLVTVLIVAGFSYAWFIMRTTDLTDFPFFVSNFQAEAECTLAGADISDYTDENGLIELSVIENDKNYIGNFRVKVNYVGDGAGYLRVKMVHKFTTGGTDEAVQHPALVPYSVATEEWYDHRSNDYCYYYMDKLDADSNENGSSIDLITGLEDGSDETIEGFRDADVHIKVAVEADMVQINRYPQIWGISNLPWKTTN